MVLARLEDLDFPSAAAQEAIPATGQVAAAAAALVTTTPAASAVHTPPVQIQTAAAAAEPLAGPTHRAVQEVQVTPVPPVAAAVVAPDRRH